jgi:solute carrier family 39 (zinc transporter), member 1/2/3
MLLFKILSSLLIFGVTCLSGFYPFFKQFKSPGDHHCIWGESLAVGVFLGAGLLHMLNNASESFHLQHIQYPIALLLAGGSFLLLLLLEHVGRSIYEEQGFGNAFALLAVCMLSIHSYLAGIALGLTQSFSMTIIILIAILTHKWAESFSLAIQLTQSKLHVKTKLILFIFFALMLPFGVLSALYLTQYVTLSPLISAAANALAAGTFIYLGTLHGLERAVLIKQCCNLNSFSFVIFGFTLMAIVALWV